MGEKHRLVSQSIYGLKQFMGKGTEHPRVHTAHVFQHAQKHLSPVSFCVFEFPHRPQPGVSVSVHAGAAH